MRTECLLSRPNFTCVHCAWDSSIPILEMFFRSPLNAFDFVHATVAGLTNLENYTRFRRAAQLP